jgi:flagellar protein FlaG
MKVDYSLPPVDTAATGAKLGVAAQAENRELIQAVHAINAAHKLGNGQELVFSLDRQTRRAVIRIVDKATKEVLRQIPNEDVLYLAGEPKIPSSGR